MSTGSVASTAEEALVLEELLLSRTYLYTLFHKLLGAVPDEAVLDVFSGSVTADAAGAYADDDATMAGFRDFLAALSAREDRVALLNEVRDEYTRLFVGPAALPALPWESPYRTKEPSVFQENTLAVRAIYRAHGLEPKRVQRVPDDHVALLCAFMAAQAASTLAVFRVDNLAQLAALLRDQQAFASEHLESWLDAFARGVRRSKTAVLYPQLIEALAAFAHVDGVFLAEAAFWAESMDDVSESDGSLALGAMERALSVLEALRPFGIDDCELVSVRQCAEAR